MSDKPQHAELIQFPVIDDMLHIGGKTIRQLASQVGQTPFYVYDREVMTQRVNDLRGILPGGISLHYAMKANPMPAVVNHMAGLVDGLDVASLGELRVALDSGMDANEISFAGPGKTDVELRAAVAAGITLNVESDGELRRLSGIGEELGIAPRVSLRVNPDFELKSSGMKMSGGPKPFGIDAEQVPDVLRKIDTQDLHFRGFHIFSGSQNLQPESLIEAQNASFELAWRLAEDAPSAVEVLNIGGGFGIPYFPGEQRLDLQPVADNLQQCLQAHVQHLAGAEVVIELGRYLVGEAGAYVCEVIDKKVSRERTYLVANGGLHHHLSLSGNFGQLIRKNYPVFKADQIARGVRECVSVVGPLCTPLDILADRMDMGAAEPGDLLVVLQSGAYGYSASPHGFLSHPEPVQVLV